MKATVLKITQKVKARLKAKKDLKKIAVNIHPELFSKKTIFLNSQLNLT